MTSDPSSASGRNAFAAGRAGCPSCDAGAGEPLRACPRCGTIRPAPQPRTATLIDHTICHVAPAGFVGSVPYAVGLVELPDGSRMLCTLADGELERLAPGLPLVLELRRLQQDGERVDYGFKAAPRHPDEAGPDEARRDEASRGQASRGQASRDQASRDQASRDKAKRTE